ncbi:MAG: carboxymuconolactone decarboxylase family protein [Chloroflexi bacterium]|nr:carboxymuconolactone decarboxylase family protein [Chloroflexota bacterium]
MELDNQTLALIAVGAAVSANCQPCLERTFDTALRCGVDAKQIAQAIEIGRRVRQGAASKMDKFVESRSCAAVPAAGGGNGGCGCG